MAINSKLVVDVFWKDEYDYRSVTRNSKWMRFPERRVLDYSWTILDEKRQVKQLARSRIPMPISWRRKSIVSSVNIKCTRISQGFLPGRLSCRKRPRHSQRQHVSYAKTGFRHNNLINTIKLGVTWRLWKSRARDAEMTMYHKRKATAPSNCKRKTRC